MTLSNLFNKIITPLQTPERYEKIGSYCLVVPFLISAVLYGYHILCIPLPIALIATAAMGFGIFKWKLHRLAMHNPLIIHLLCLALINFSLRPADYFNVPLTETEIVLVGFASFFFIIGACELFPAFLRRALSDETHPEHFWKCWLVSFVPCFTMFIFLSSETYFTNRDELQYTYWDFAPHFWFITLILSVAAAAMMCLMKEVWIRRTVCTITGFLVCVYAQYMFMNNDLPLVGVDDIEWDSMTGKGIVNAVIWVALFILPFLLARFTRKKNEKPEAVPKAILLLSGALGGIQLISLVIVAVTAKPPSVNSGVLRLSSNEQFVLSSKKNVITLILDAADQKLFEAARAEHPERFECMRDFTYYPNIAMEYDSTFLSIPSMLTAAKTTPTEDIQGWYSAICQDTPAQTFYKRLHDANYTVHAYGKFTYQSNYSPFYGMLDNLIVYDPGTFFLNTDALYASLRKLSAYRALPLLLKRFSEPPAEIGNEAITVKDHCIHQNYQFLDKLPFSLSESTNNYFTVQHLVGLHAFGSGTREENMDRCLKIIEEYIKQLKAFGVYDDALIIITADHGSHNQPVNMPIWYIKKPHDKGDQIQVCNSPISLSDYAATVLDVMGLLQSGDTEILGRPISAIPEDEQRTRLVFQRKNFSDPDDEKCATRGYLLGYYFTGDKDDLLKHEQNDPPDVILHTPHL